MKLRKKTSKNRKMILEPLAVMFLLASTIGVAIALFSNWSINKWFTLIPLYFINLITNVWLFLQTRPLESKLSWMLVLLIFPIFGHIIFYLTGQRFLSRQSYHQYFAKNGQQFSLGKKTTNEKLYKGDFLLQSLENITKRQFKNLNFDYYHENIDFFKAVLKQLSKAKKFIHIEVYIIRRGELMEEFFEVLSQKVQEGVEVRIIVDTVGTLGAWKALKKFETAGIKIVYYQKINVPYSFSQAFYRTHRKMFIIDGEIVFSGGNNIADEYISFNKNFGHWLDAGFSVTGDLVFDYNVTFLNSWNNCNKKEILKLNEYGIVNSKWKYDGKNIGLVVEDSPEINDNLIEDFLLMLIANAKKNIKIATPYFIPTIQLIKAIKRALRSGIKIEIYFPGKKDHKIVFMSSIYELHKLWQEEGLHVYLVNNLFLHSKFAVIDDEYGYIGTMNLDFRSLHSQLEINTFVKGNAVKDLERGFEQYRQISQTFEQLKHIEKPKKFFTKFFLNIFKATL
ncbi:phospholipase D-like domain-containing protein [Candidatus Mycoplasma pogonae]